MILAPDQLTDDDADYCEQCGHTASFWLEIYVPTDSTEPFIVWHDYLSCYEFIDFEGTVDQFLEKTQYHQDTTGQLILEAIRSPRPLNTNLSIH